MATVPMLQLKLSQNEAKTQNVGVTIAEKGKALTGKTGKRKLGRKR